MTADSIAINIGAIVLYFLIWIAYEAFFDGPLRRPQSLNAKMILIRQAWMARILERDNLMVDASLIGHSIHTATFFASTTVLALAGLLGILGSSDRVYAAVSSISMFIAVNQTLFEWKIALLVGIFVYTFFKFTWALRQFNYFCAIIGSAPRGTTATAERAGHAAAMARRSPMSTPGSAAITSALPPSAGSPIRPCWSSAPSSRSSCWHAGNSRRRPPSRSATTRAGSARNPRARASSQTWRRR
jgi:uncharacterized membrane protein